MCLADAGAAEWVASAPLEERIVAYADKRATQRVVSLDQRFERWRRKHPRYRQRLAEALAMARALEATVCAAAAVRADEVERLRWVDDAIARARANGVLPRAEAGDEAGTRADVHVPLDQATA
jgi:hypothetical protein